MNTFFNLSHYTFSYYAFPNLIVGSLIIGFGVFTLFREHFSKVAITFFLSTLTFAGWQFSDVGLYLCNDPATALLLGRTLMVSVDCIVICNYLFALTMAQLYDRYRYLTW